MARVIVHLSGKIGKPFRILPGDILYHVEGMGRNRVIEGSRVLPPVDQYIEKELCQNYVSALLESSGNNDQINYSKSFFNDYYSYSVRPVFLIMLAIKLVFAEHQDKELIVLSAPTTCKIIPLFGFKTSESKRGSKDLLGSIVAEQMKNNRVFGEVCFEEAKGDLLCKENYRKGFLKVANFVFTLLFLLKVTVLSFGRARRRSVTSALLYRNLHQARFASKISLADQNFSLLFIPQLTHGGIISALKLNNYCKESRCSVKISVKDIIRSVNVSRTSSKNLACTIGKDGFTSYIYLEELTLPVRMSWLVSEIMAMSIVSLYSALLSQILGRINAERLVNFELVGRMAGVEAMCAREQGVRVKTIQTALISSRPHPIFPYCDRFFTDSEATHTMLEGIGVIADGVVEFEGSVYDVQQVRYSDRLSKIVFYTQPYDPEVTSSIISELLQWQERVKGELIIKLHPRDSKSEYKGLDIEHLIADEHQTLDYLFHWADLTVTRTSSVAKESLSSGCPIQLCLWSDSDRALRSDYIHEELRKNYTSTNKKEFLYLLQNVEKLISANRFLQEYLFGNKEFAQLLRALNDS